MATIRTELYRDGEQQPWATISVLADKKSMTLTFQKNNDNSSCYVGILSKKDAEQLGDIIRNASIDYMEDSEE